MHGRLGLGRAVPSESTIRRTLQAVDAEALDSVVSGWLAARSAAPARGIDGRPVHLLAAFDQASGVVLGQTVVDGKTNEINAFAPLLDRLDITGAVITADALHTQHRHARYLTDRGGHDMLTVKRTSRVCTTSCECCPRPRSRPWTAPTRQRAMVVSNRTP